MNHFKMCNNRCVNRWLRLTAVLSWVPVSGLLLAAPVRYGSLAKGKSVFHYVIAEQGLDSVSVETRFAPRLTPMRRLWGDDEPVAAITGTFFAWENQRPVGDVILNGDLVAKGRRGSVLAVDWFGRVHVFHPPYRQHLDYSPYRFALRGTVRLVESGKVVPNPKAQKFRDASIWGRAARTAVGVTKEGHLVMMATPNAVSLSQLGWAMVGLGVADAVSLDGGGSTSLFYRGQMVVSTSRRLSNILCVYERSPFDTSFREHLDQFGSRETEEIVKAIGKRKKPGQ